MSYCVNCGVELGEGTKVCPLCQTPVVNPRDLEPREVKPFFATRQEKIQPVSKRSMALLLTSMFASVAVCCGLLNLALRPDLMWSLYAAGAAVMLWIFFVPPLIWRNMTLPVKTFLNMGAVALYVLLIALETRGMDWYMELALPILFTGAVLVLVICDFVRDGKHSLLTSSVAVLIGVGLQCGMIEFVVDRYVRGTWQPGWSLIVVAVCIGLSVPLIVVRSVSSLREEARRRFHV